MIDNRDALKDGYEFLFHEAYRCIIKNEIGRGSSCIVYDAVYYDTSGIGHCARVKECYPVSIDMWRSSDGALKCAEAQQDNFKRAKDRFYCAYKDNVEIGNIPGLVNSTAKAVDIFSCNHTWYSVFTFDEGINYNVFKDENVKSVFTRLITLAKVIQKYHQNNILHLDIKPGNVLIISETKENIKLFDFDSLLSMDKLKSDEEIRLSFSDGFAAPELVQGKRDKICKATDIYSLGAIAFYKVFGRVPNIRDGMIGARYDYSDWKYKDVRYPLKFYKKLDEFFMKTLSVVVKRRYADVSIVIEELTELERLSDLEGYYLCQNFTYHTADFVGRRDLLSEIKEHLEESNVLFLHGIGGIGKTEAAKRFAYENQRTFNRIQFVPFVNTLKETVCGDELKINDFERNEGESEDAYFERKISMLKALAEEDDLIILDNVDVDLYKDQEKLLGLEELLELNCRFLITTREDFSDWGYVQAEVGEMENIEDLIWIFEICNQVECSDTEKDSIIKIIEFVDRHTMTVNLIAKYIRRSGELPSELLEKMLGKEGITNTGSLPVGHRKDRSLKADSINRHLLVLFNLFRFDEYECELLMSLSLFGPVRIAREIFLKLFDACDSDKRLDALIKNGWIEEDGESGKISLHQIILDLIYNHLKPDADKCPVITKAMTDFFREKEESGVRRQNKKRLAQYFIERIDGTGHKLAELYLAFFCGIEKNEEWLEKAEGLCEKERSESSEEVRARIQIVRLEQCMCSYDCWEDGSFEAAFEEVYDQVYQKELELFDTLRSIAELKGRRAGVELAKSDDDIRVWMDAYDRIPETDCLEVLKEKLEALNDIRYRERKSQIEKGLDISRVIDDSLLLLYLQMEQALEKVALRMCDEFFVADAKEYRGILNIYSDAEDMLKFVLEMAENHDVSFESKVKIYKAAIHFYENDDFSELARCSCVGDMSKSAEYSEALHILRQTQSVEKNRAALEGPSITIDGRVTYLDGTSYMDAADDKKFQGNNQEAIQLYKKALECEECGEDTILYRMSDAYVNLKDYENAERCLKQALEYDIRYGYDVAFTKARIVELYQQSGRVEEAIAICRDNIRDEPGYGGNIETAEMGDMAIDDIVTDDIVTDDMMIDDMVTKAYFIAKKERLEGTRILCDSTAEKLKFCFSIIAEGSRIPERLSDAFILYSDYLYDKGRLREAMELLFEYAERFRIQYDEDGAGKLYAKIVETQDFLTADKAIYVKAMLRWAVNLSQRYWGRDCDRARMLCDAAAEQIDENMEDHDFIEALLYDTIIKLPSDSADYIYAEEYPQDRICEARQRCNYYLLTDRALRTEEPCSREYDAWQECFDQYMDIRDFDMALVCLQKMYSAVQKLEEAGDRKAPAGTDYADYYGEYLKYCRKKEDQEGMRICAGKMFELLDCLHRSKKKDNEYRLYDMFEEIAEVMEELGELESEIYVHLLKMFEMCSPEGFERYYNRNGLFDKDYIKSIFSGVKDYVPEYPENDIIDSMVDSMDKIIQCCERSGQLQDMAAFCRNTEERYRYTQIEFKR